VRSRRARLALAEAGLEAPERGDVVDEEARGRFLDLAAGAR